MAISQMMGFMLVLGTSVFVLVIMSFFGHDDIEVSHGLTDGDHGPSLLSVRNLFLFAAGFGAAGGIATHLGYAVVPACLWGGLSGVVTALLGWLFYRTISNQQSSTNTNTRSLIGRRATVSTHIPAGQVGQVVTTDPHGSTIYLDARSSEEGQVFAEGEAVRITDAAGNLVRVAKQAVQSA